MKRIHKKILAIFTAILLAVTTFVLAGEKTFSAWAVDDLETVDETTSQTEGNMGDIYIGNVEIPLDQLIQNHYKVTIPVTMPNNTGFSILQFGVKWDVTKMSVQGARCTGDIQLPVLTFSDDKRQIWMMFLEADCKETNLCSLTALLNSDVKVGDTFTLEGAYSDYAGNPAQYTDPSMKAHDVNIVSGSITVVDDVASEVDLELGSVKVSMRDLDEHDYMVEVPVTASKNTGFCDMVFGFRWDTSKVTAEPPSGDTPEGLSLIPTIDNKNGVGWIHVISSTPYTGSEICTLRFTIPDTAKPGQSFAITGCMQNGTQTASVANRSGAAGTLTIQDGKIMAASTQAANPFAFGKVVLPEINVAMEDLESSDYLVSVPITITEGSCFTQLAFGVKWDTNDLSIVSCTCDDTKNLGMMESYYENDDGVWLQFLYRGAYDAFTGSELCTLTFRVRSDISLGDKIILTPSDTSDEGDSMMIVSTKGTYGDLNMQKGSIKLVSPDELTAAATVKIGDVEITEYNLWLKSYLVDIPITLNRNSGISGISFGVAWDKGVDHASVLDSTDISVLGVNRDFTTDPDQAWLEFNSVDPSSGYVYWDKNLGVLKLRLSEDLKAGDVITLSGVSLSAGGVVATVESADGSLSSPALVSGSIRILPNPDTTETTPAETTETTTETTTTTTIETTTSAEETTTETTTSVETTTSESLTAEETTTETTVTTETATESETTTTVSETTAPATTTSHNTTVRGNRLNRTTLTIRAGQTSRLEFYPADGSGEDCVWLSSDPNVVKVSPTGNAAQIELVGGRTGTTEVTVLYAGQVYSCQVTVLAADSQSSGDVNGDSQTDLSDLVTLNKILVGQVTPDGDESQSADLNGDGYVDSRDALLLMQLLMQRGLLS